MTGQTQQRSERFFRNVLWSWLGVAVMIVSGIFLSPYLIHKLGADGYGVWVLVFGLIENYWLFDLGLRSATLKYAAHYRATNEPDKVNEVINTGVVYCAAIALALAFGSVVLARNVERFFQVPAAEQKAFEFLVVVVGGSWACGVIFNVFNACLEGFQHFDISSRIWITVTALRVTGSVVLLFLGYRLIALGILVVSCQIFGYLLSYWLLRRVFPQQRFSLSLVKFSMFKQMAGYGIHSLTGALAIQALNQSAPLLIGHFRPAAFVGYFSVPVKLLQYTGDAMDRVGQVTGSNAAELTAKGEIPAISRLGIYVNRYCLTLFLPLAVFLLVYAQPLIRVWIRKSDYVALSAPLIPVLLIGTTLAIAGQVNSSAILYGMAKHRWYARGLLVEGAALIAALCFLVPRYGLMGAAWAVSLLMLADRGLFTPWLLCRQLQFSYARYMRAIYARPLLTALPVTVFAYWLRSAVLPGRSLIEVLAAAASIALLHLALAFFTCLEREHRSMILGRVIRRGRLVDQRAEAA